jgi:hypothetical protein
MPKAITQFGTAERIVMRFGFSWHEMKKMYHILKSRNGKFVTEFTEKQFELKDIYGFYIEVANFIQQDHVSAVELMNLLEN